MMKKREGDKPGKKPPDPHDVELVKALAAEGMSIREIAAKFERGVSTIRAWVKS